LCHKDDAACRAVVAVLRAQGGSEFRAAADRYDALTDQRVEVTWGRDARLNLNGSNTDGDPETWVGGVTPFDKNSPIMLAGDQSRGDFLITAVHESMHFGEGLNHGNVASDTRINHAEYRAFKQLSQTDQAGAVRFSDKFYHQWGEKYGKHPIPGSEQAAKWP